MAAQLMLGIIVGYLLLVFFLGMLARFYIFTRANWRAMTAATPRAFVIRAQPEAFLHLATHSFVSMIATGAIMTTAFSGVDWGNTSFMREYGMNNVCLFFALPPSTYVIPSYWLITAFCILRYCVLDSERLLRMRTSRCCKYMGIATNGIFAIVAMVFNMVWSVDIDTDVVAHELPFLMLVMCIPMVYIMHVWEMSFTERPACHTIVLLSIYIHVSVFYALSVVALRYNNMSPEYAKPLQWLWLGLSALCPPAAFPPSYWSFLPCARQQAKVIDVGVPVESHIGIPVEPRDPDDDLVPTLTPVKIQVRPARSETLEVRPVRPVTPEESRSFNTAASQSTAFTSGSREKLQEQPAAAWMPEVQLRASQTAAAPLRFAMGLNPSEVQAQPASASLAEARALDGSRLPSEAAPTSPTTSQAPSAMVSTLRSQGAVATRSTPRSLDTEELPPAELATKDAVQEAQVDARTAKDDTAGESGAEKLSGTVAIAADTEVMSTNPFEEDVAAEGSPEQPDTAEVPEAVAAEASPPASSSPKAGGGGSQTRGKTGDFEEEV